MDYVAGFAFTSQNRKVTLIQKQRPKWQRGMYNGVGGRIQEGERPIEAMVREFEEEAGVKVFGWENFITLVFEGNQRVYFFRAFLSPEEAVRVRTMTDEPVVQMPVKEITHLAIISNLAWLIPMALEREFKYDIEPPTR